MMVQIGVIVALSVALLTGGCGKTDEPAPPPATGPTALPLPESAIAIAESRTIRPEFSLPGVVEALQQAEVHPEIKARLTAIHFSAGDLVKEGDLLAELDPSEYKANLSAAEAELQSARANALQAETNFKRAEDLKPRGYISGLDYDKALAAIGVARAAVAKAEAQLEKARLDLAHTKIYAPFSGRISKPRHAVGNLLQPSGKQLFELVQLDPIYAATNVELGIYNAFVLRRDEWKRQGKPIPKLELLLKLAGGGDYPHRGEFENWSHQSDQSSGMIKGRALFPNPDGLLLPGQNITVIGRSVASYERLMIPQMAVMQDQQGYYVMVVDDEDRIQRKNLTLGVRDGSEWAVVEGLDEGARVVQVGAQTLRPGTLVSLKPAP
jgi:RND family efflux transporter MFP subunit